MCVLFWFCFCFVFVLFVCLFVSMLCFCFCFVLFFVFFWVFCFCFLFFCLFVFCFSFVVCCLVGPRLLEKWNPKWRPSETCAFNRVGHIWTFFFKSGMKQVVSMAKFGVDHKSVITFDLRWRLVRLKFENSKWPPKWHIFARKCLIFIQYWLISCLFIGYLGQGTPIWNS